LIAPLKRVEIAFDKWKAINFQLSLDCTFEDLGARALNKEVDLKLTLSPQKRLEEARALVSRVAGEIAFGDLELLLDENVLEIPAGSEDLIATKASLYVHRLGAKEPESARERERGPALGSALAKLFP
jgi:hypothetical protein